MKASGQSSHGHPSRVSVVAYLPPLTSRKAWHAWSMLLRAVDSAVCGCQSVSVSWQNRRKKPAKVSKHMISSDPLMGQASLADRQKAVECPQVKVQIFKGQNMFMVYSYLSSHHFYMCVCVCVGRYTN